jgi:hypothetical protein
MMYITGYCIDITLIHLFHDIAVQVYYYLWFTYLDSINMSYLSKLS